MCSTCDDFKHYSCRRIVHKILMVNNYTLFFFGRNLNICCRFHGNFCLYNNFFVFVFFERRQFYATLGKRCWCLKIEKKFLVLLFPLGNRLPYSTQVIITFTWKDNNCSFMTFLVVVPQFPNPTKQLLFTVSHFDEWIFSFLFWER